MADNSKGKQSQFELIIGAVDKFSNTFKRPMPSLEEVLAELPPLVWPEVS